MMLSRYNSDSAVCLLDDPASGNMINNCAARIHDFWQLTERIPGTDTGLRVPIVALNAAIDSVLIHEVSCALASRRIGEIINRQLSHAYYCGMADDVKLEGRYGAYGWKNACLMKRQDNTGESLVFMLQYIMYLLQPDSIALFAAAVKLVKIGHVVNEDGSFHLQGQASKRSIARKGPML